jgi:predicted ArsR family transcriptional regulator
MARPSKQQLQHQRRVTLRPHPLRDQIVDALGGHDEPLSPAKLSEVTGVTLGAVAYHVRTLHAAGLIELAREARVRGAVEHFYALTDIGREERLTDPAKVMLALCGALTQPGDGNGLPQPTPVDDQAREELSRLLDQLRPRVQKVAAAAARRAT